MYINAFRCDLKNGFVREYKKFILAAGLFVALCVDFFLRSESMRKPMNADTSTLGDYLMYVFAGIAEFRPEKGDPFQFPALWMLVMLLILYIVLYYPYKDLMGYGKQVLISTRSRTVWWLSKCGWLVTNALCYFALLYAVVFLFCALIGVPLSLHTSEYFFLYYITSETRVLNFPQTMNLVLLVMPWLLVMAVGLLQMLLSLFIRPLYSYCVSVALLLASTYYLNPFLLGNYAMILRSNRVVTNGV